MASLSDILGAMIIQIGRGRSQADVAMLEVARLYQQNPLLKEFPIPRLTLDEVVVDLKVAIRDAPIPEKTLTPDVKTEIVRQAAELITSLPDKNPVLRGIVKENPEVKNIWQKEISQHAIQRITNILTEGSIIDPKLIATGMASLVSSHITHSVIARNVTIKVERAQSFLGEDLPKLESEMIDQFQKVVESVLKAQPITASRLEMLVTASELQSISPERITTMRLTLSEADQSWTEYETGNGKKVQKLVPD